MIKVGCCGYPIAMKRYHEVFSLVELNSTFYQYPRMSTVAGWREKAPPKFEFAVKAHQDISHRFKFETKPSLQAFTQMKHICETLKARVLLIQTPASLRPDRLGEAEKFFRRVEKGNLVVAWETRGPAWEEPKTRRELAEALRELDVPHVTDPFRTLPAYTSSVAYFRLHGLGKELYYYQFTDDELKHLHGLVKPFEAKGKEVYVLFNNLAMFDDGLRFKRFIETGEFPSLTEVVGIESVKSVIEKTRYPVEKSTLLKRLGWRLVEIEEGRQIRLSELLKEAPSKTYNDVQEVLRGMRLRS